MSTSERLRMRPEVVGAEEEVTNDFLFNLGRELDEKRPHWMGEAARDTAGHGVVVDSIRTKVQEQVWSVMSADFQGVVKVNVHCGVEELRRRHAERGTALPKYNPFLFDHPDFVWRSDLVPVAHAVQAIRAMSGGGFVDVVVGAQYGSEGKGKLCALIARGYDVLVRSGGPNAGHWVRDTVGEEVGGHVDAYEYCFHHIPSGTIANPKAKVMIAAGAAINPEKFYTEVLETGCADRLVLDHNAVAIQPSDIDEENGGRFQPVGPDHVKVEGSLVSFIGSTGQGVGAALRRRIQRYPQPKFNIFKNFYGHVSSLLQDQLAGGARVMLEGTQGSGLSMFHGPFPYVTSRDTNVSGMLSEVGVPPTWVRDVWMVVRSLPIRTGGNSGPMYNELSWREVGDRLNIPTDVLETLERTSTTKRIRRVGEFDAGQFKAACRINGPTKLFLTFADYITPGVAGVREWSELGMTVMTFINLLENIADCPVVGVSTGRTQAEVAWRPGYKPGEVAL